jgi:glucokinase
LNRLVIDIGGTNTRVCLVDETPAVVFKERISYSDDIGGFRAILKESCRKFLSREETADVVGLSVAGGYLLKSKRIWIPNLFGTELVCPFDLLDLDENHLFVTNDRVSGAIGEMEFGKAKGVRDFLYISIGTGVGMGIVSNGMVIEGSNGLAGSAGWLRFDEERIEYLVGGVGITSKYEELTGEKLPAYEIFTLAEQGAPKAAEVVNRAGRYLGKLISCFLNSTDPERIVLSGSIGRRWRSLKNEALRSIESHKSPMVPIPQILLSNLGEDAQILGTTILMQRKQTA